jgi:DNA adenine methylase
MNYDITALELHDYTHIGEDYREREAINKVRRNFIRKLNRLPATTREAVLKDLLTLAK